MLLLNSRKIIQRINYVAKRHYNEGTDFLLYNIISLSLFELYL